MNDVGIDKFRGRLCVLDDKELWKSALDAIHCSKFSSHIEVTKMYQDLKRTHW